MLRTRTKKVEAAFGGKDCEGMTTEKVNCDTQKCLEGEHS